MWSPWTGIVDWALVCRHFAQEFQKMGGKIFLNYEVIGFSEMTESKEKGELAPILVQSKDRVGLRTLYNFSFPISLSCVFILVYTHKECADMWWFTLGPFGSNDRM